LIVPLLEESEQNTAVNTIVVVTEEDFGEKYIFEAGHLLH